MVAVIQERLKDFPVKTVPVLADIFYLGNSAASFAEVQVTLENIFSGYSPMLPSLVGLSSSANTLPFFSDVDEFDLAAFTPFGQSVVACVDDAALFVVLGLGTSATKDATDDSKPSVASVNAAVTGNLVMFFDDDGTVTDSGYYLVSDITDVWGGGGATNTFAADGLLATMNVVASILSCTNAVAISTITPGTDTLAVTFTGDPGANTQLRFIATSIVL